MDKLIYNESQKLIEVIVPAKKRGIPFYFVMAIYIAASVIPFPGIFHYTQKLDIRIFDAILVYGCLLFLLYIGMTGILSLLWTLFGKEQIIVDEKTIWVNKILFFNLTSNCYFKDRISDVYVNSFDYKVNKISKDRNAFLHVFRNGTIHFNYDKRLQHVCGGMTDEEGKKFLEKINLSSLPLQQG